MTTVKGSKPPKKVRFVRKQVEVHLSRFVQGMGWYVKKFESTPFKQMMIVVCTDYDWSVRDEKLSRLHWEISLHLQDNPTDLTIIWAPRNRKEATYRINKKEIIEVREPVGKPSRRSTRRF